MCRPIVALLALVLACHDQPTTPSEGPLVPPGPGWASPSDRPSYSTTSTSVTVDLDGGGLSACVFTDPLNHFPPLVFPPGEWAWLEHGCFGEQGRNGSSEIFTVFNASAQSFTLTAPVHSLSGWVIPDANDVTIYAYAGQVVVDQTFIAHPSNRQVGDWSQINLSASGNQIDRVVVVPAHTFQGGFWIVDDVTLTTETGPAPGFTGFFQPVDNDGVLNVVKVGSAIPVKFSLGGDFGLDVLLKIPTASAITCPTGAGADDIEQVTTSPSGLTYDAASGQYTYVWKTLSGWKGTCKQLHLPLSDGVDHTALFQFK
jgi:hypothetical protein